MAQAEPAPNVEQTQQAAEAGSASQSKGQAEGNFSAATTVSSVGELRSKAPEFWKAFQEGIALNIIREQQKHNVRMKELNRKGREQSK